MNPSAYDDNAMLPSEPEREKIFYWLKKLSSVTAWRRILQFYKAWAEVTENSVRVADERGWGAQTSLPHSEYVLILKCLAHCEEGVRRLGNGDKRVFKFDANGEFAMAWRILSHWSKMLTRIELGESIINEKHTPQWTQFHTALTHVCQTWGECASEILEPRYLEEPALTMYGRWLKREFSAMPFPIQLTAVPDPFDNVFIRTNEWTPYSGIWEPIDTPKPAEPSVMSLFTRVPQPKPPFRAVGTMNYLHGGSKAPQMMLQTANDTFDLNTTWRLLWRDDRYINGTVPEEEAHYQFTTPKENPPQSWIVTQETRRWWTENVGTAAISTPPVSVAGGGVCVVAGYYHTLSKIASRRFFKEGELFPEFTSSTFATFWQWDANQTE